MKCTECGIEMRVERVLRDGGTVDDDVVYISCRNGACVSFGTGRVYTVKEINEAERAEREN